MEVFFLHLLHSLDYYQQQGQRKKTGARASGFCGGRANSKKSFKTAAVVWNDESKHCQDVSIRQSFVEKRKKEMREGKIVSSLLSNRA